MEGDTDKKMVEENQEKHSKASLSDMGRTRSSEFDKAGGFVDKLIKNGIVEDRKLIGELIGKTKDLGVFVESGITMLAGSIEPRCLDVLNKESIALLDNRLKEFEEELETKTLDWIDMLTGYFVQLHDDEVEIGVSDQLLITNQEEANLRKQHEAEISFWESSKQEEGTKGTDFVSFSGVKKVIKSYVQSRLDYLNSANKFMKDLVPILEEQEKVLETVEYNDLKTVTRAFEEKVLNCTLPWIAQNNECHADSARENVDVETKEEGSVASELPTAAPNQAPPGWSMEEWENWKKHQ